MHDTAYKAGVVITWCVCCQSAVKSVQCFLGNASAGFMKIIFLLKISVLQNNRHFLSHSCMIGPYLTVNVNAAKQIGFRAENLYSKKSFPFLKQKNRFRDCKHHYTTHSWLPHWLSYNRGARTSMYCRFMHATC